jgi:sugar lactone lactonase YvrE
MPPIPITAASVFHPAAGEADRFLPEGPRSIVLEGRPALAWVNIQTAVDSTRGDIHVRFWDGEHRTYSQPRRPGFLFPTDKADTLFVGMEKEIGVLHLTTNTFTPWEKIDDANPRTIINDGEIVPGGGAIIFGTKDVKFADTIANLYLFTLDDRKLSVLADKQTCSNGKVFARDSVELLLYDIDTPKRNVVRYRLDIASRRLADTTEALNLKNQLGFPDGMTDVGDGSVIIAFYNPDPAIEGRAVRFDLKTDQTVEMWATPGSPRVTCPLLVEHQGKVRLVLTTATEGMPNEMRKTCLHAGDLFWAGTSLLKVPPSEVVVLGD